MGRGGELHDRIGGVLLAGQEGAGMCRDRVVRLPLSLSLLDNVGHPLLVYHNLNLLHSKICHF